MHGHFLQLITGLLILLSVTACNGSDISSQPVPDTTGGGGGGTGGGGGGPPPTGVGLPGGIPALGGGLGAAPGAGGRVRAGGSDIVIRGNHIHNNGNMDLAVEHDVHGVSASNGTQRVWVLENEIHHNSGDAIQVGHGHTPGAPSDIYFGRNSG